MKKLLLLLLLSANVQMAIKDSHVEICAESTAWAQRMQKEGVSLCPIGERWDSDSLKCVASKLFLTQCPYCGLQVNNIITHEKRCRCRPHIEYEYDEAGNRIKRETVIYRMGRKQIIKD